LLVEQVTAAKAFLNNTTDRIKYANGPGLTWEEPIPVTDGKLGSYNYNTDGIVTEISRLTKSVSDAETNQDEVNIYDAVFERPELLYIICSPKCFMEWELYIILNLRSLEIRERSSFVHYRQKNKVSLILLLI